MAEVKHRVAGSQRVRGEGLDRQQGPDIVPDLGHLVKDFDFIFKSFSSFPKVLGQLAIKKLEKEMATHSSVLACRIPGTGEAGGLPSMGSHRVGHD